MRSALPAGHHLRRSVAFDLVPVPRILRRALGALGLAVIVLTCTAAMSGPRAATASDGGGDSTLTTPKAIVLGAVEGFTEYLPVSSTGHLLVVERLLDLGVGEDAAATDSYTIVIQLGAILAVLGIYRRRFVLMGEGVLGRSAEGRTTLTALVVAFIPAVVVAQLFGDTIKEELLEPWPVVIAWAAGSIAIFAFVAWGDRFRATTPSIGAMSVRQAAIIGVAQTLALWPGTSRSLVTILAAVAVGLELVAAVEFSFLLGFVTLSAATAYELLTNGSEIYDMFGLWQPLIGIVVAGICAFASVKWMVAYLQRHSLAIFGWYRLAAGAATAVLLVTGVI
ncbi:MAG TPA: undecaprenyl-diphosphate phosphatase [Microthrixaceae bacterium]|nr:undecaprenyl-diphosphate phosphatase [Microthrixaceae bacterium]